MDMKRVQELVDQLVTDGDIPTGYTEEEIQAALEMVAGDRTSKVDTHSKGHRKKWEFKKKPIEE